MKSIRNIRDVLRILRKNGSVLAEFEVIYKVLTTSVFVPAFWGMLNLTMEAAGYSYLTRENILDFAGNPVTIIGILLLLLCMTAYALVDIGAIVYIMDQSFQGRRTTVFHAFGFSVRNSLRVLRRKNAMIMFVILFMAPFLNIGMASSFLSTLSVPDIFREFIDSHWYLSEAFSIGVLLLGFLLVRWLYSFHYFTLEGCDFREARKRSRALSRRSWDRDFLFLLIGQAACYLIYILLSALIVGAVALIARWAVSVWQLPIVADSAVWVCLTILLAAFAAIVPPVCYACISVLYYRRKEEAGEAIVHLPPAACVEDPNQRRRFRRLEGTAFLIGAVCCGFCMYGVFSGNVSINVEYLKTAEVTAHRGASAYYPENTMSAFEGAVELGADWIELDVQQTRDGQIVVMHDTNLYRTTGWRKNIWEADWEEVRKQDAGSWFSPEFAGEKIPLLSEVVAFAKDKGVRLNIELKPTGHERDFEKAVVDIIREYKWEEKCVVTSQAYQVLERVKAYDPEITTVYVMSLAYGNISRLTAADLFSVESTSVSEPLVSQVHNEGKQIYAWTLNKESAINKMIEWNVDNIITDDITLARECIYRYKTSELVGDYVDILTED